MRILVISGHPDEKSLSSALADAYTEGAKRAGAQVHLLALHRLSFNPNLQYGYRQRSELEPDLREAQSWIRWADHLVWVYPVWWGSVPALLKGFIDRVLLPGFAFEKKPDGYQWKKLLRGRTARLICTLDQPPWYYRLRYGRPSTRAMREVTLHFCGLSRVRSTAFGPVCGSTGAKRKRWIDQVDALGERDRGNKRRKGG